MVTVSITLSEEDAALLQARAIALSIAPEALAAAMVHDELNDDDDELEALARRIVDKNRELYRRLA